MVEDRLAAAVRNNADWCAAIVGSHGGAGRFDTDAWIAAGPTPTYYPEAVTLAPELDAAALVARLPAGPGGSVKDSFGSLHLSAFGFRVLFAASWITRSPGSGSGSIAEADPGVGSRWSAVTSVEELDRWVDAWSGEDGPVDVFRPALLDDPAVTIVAGRDRDGAIVAGAAWYRSAGVLGVSNVFGSPSPWPPMLALATARHPRLPVVGYESGADLDAALAAGCTAIGPLRVWSRDP